MVFGIFSSSSRSDGLSSSNDNDDENATIESESSIDDDTHSRKMHSILRRKYGRSNNTNKVVLTPKKFERKVSWSHTIESRQDYYHVKKDESSTSFSGGGGGTFESIADNDDDYRSSGESQTFDSGIFSSATSASSAQSSCTSHDTTTSASSASTSDQTSFEEDDNTRDVVDDSLRSMITSESLNSIEVEHKDFTPPPPTPSMMGPTLTERKRLQYRSNLLCASVSISEATFDKYKGTTGSDDDDEDENEENDMQVGNGMTNVELPIMQPTPTMSAYKKVFHETLPPAISTKRHSTVERKGEGGIDLPMLQPTPTMSAYKKVLLEIAPPILSIRRQYADRGGNNNNEALLTPSSIFIPPEQIDLPDELPNSPSNLTIQSNSSISSSMEEQFFGDNEKGEERGGGGGGGENTSHHRQRASSDDTSLRTATKEIGNYGAIFNIQKQADTLAGHIGLILGTNKWNWFNDTTLETTQSTMTKNISLVPQNKESNASVLKSEEDEASESESKSEDDDDDCEESIDEEDEVSESQSKSEDVDSEDLNAAIKTQSTDLSNLTINENDIVKTDKNNVSNDNRCEKESELSYQKKTHSSDDEYETKKNGENDTSQNSRKARVKDVPILDDELYDDSPNGSDLSDSIITQVEVNEVIFDEKLDFTRTRSKTIGTQTAGVDTLSKMDQIPMNVMEKKNDVRKHESKRQWFWGRKKSTKSEEQYTPSSVVPESPFPSFSDRFTPRQLPDGRVHDADNDCNSSCVSADSILVELKLIEDTAKVMYQQIILGESGDMGPISALFLPEEEETELVLEKVRVAIDEENNTPSIEQQQQQHSFYQHEENIKVSRDSKKGGKLSKLFGRRSKR
jgi:hypothetical protein